MIKGSMLDILSDLFLFLNTTLVYNLITRTRGWVCSGRRDPWLDLIKRILCQSQFSEYYFLSLTCCRSTNSWWSMSIPCPPSATSSPPWIFFFDSHPPFSEIGNIGELSLYQIILFTHVYAELLEGGPRPQLGADFQCSLASHGRYTEVTEASGGGSKGAASPGPNSRIDGY